MQCIKKYSGLPISYARRLYSSLPPKQETLEKFVFPKKSSSIDQINSAVNNEIIPTLNTTLHGWVDQRPKRMSSSLTFAKLRDSNGDTIQLVDRSDSGLIRGLKSESAISVTGKLETRTTFTGDKVPELVVEKVNILNKANIAGSQLTSGNASENIPPEYRFMQLRQKVFQDNIKRRAKIMSTARCTLDSLGFTEIETPLLFKSTPEGAREFLVPTRRAKFMYALPQSPQQYKQLLMASGVYRYYQIAKCFRDEDLRADRQPEFTQLDIEMSFSSGIDVRTVLEKLVSSVWKRLQKPLYIFGEDGLKAYDECSPFTSLTYSECLSNFGIDKPDLRYDLEIQQLPVPAIENDEFPVLEAIVIQSNGTELLPLEKFIYDKGSYPSRPAIVKQIPAGFNRAILGDWLSGIVNNSDIGELYESLSSHPQGTIISFGTRAHVSYENPTPLGKFRQLVIENHPKRFLRLKQDGTPISESDFVASWVVDFPLFNPLEKDTTGASTYPIYDYTKFTSTHHPFTMVEPDDYDQLQSNPLKARGQHYDLVINGVEVGGGSTRIHDVALQKFVFENILGINNYMQLFGHLLRAFETGCPPHAGFAIGFDRMTAMLSGTSSIRDVIAFPKTVTGADVMIGSPSKVTPDQLKPYHIKV